MAQVRKELKGIAGKARTQIQKDYVAWPLISGDRHDGDRGGDLHHEDEDERPWSRPQAAREASRPQLGRKRPWGARSACGLAHRPDRSHVVRLRGEVLRQLVDRRSFREPFLRTLTANVAANVIRNMWSYAIIFCGHFPDQTYTFTEQEVRTRPAAVGTSAAHRRSQHRRWAAVPRPQRQPRLSGRASPVPGHAEHALRRDRAEGARDLHPYGLPYNSGPFHKQLGLGPADDLAARVPRREAPAEARRLRRAPGQGQGRERRAEDRRGDGQLKTPGHNLSGH